MRKNNYQPFNTSKRKKIIKVNSSVNITDDEAAYYLRKVKEILIYVYITSDIQELMITDIISMFKKMGIYQFDMKNNISRLKSLVEMISAELTKNCNDDQKIEFGTMSDVFKIDLDNFLNQLYTRVIFDDPDKAPIISHDNLIRNISINYHWNIENLNLSFETKNILELEAEKRIYEMRKEGYTSGELVYELDDVTITGWWSFSYS